MTIGFPNRGNPARPQGASPPGTVGDRYAADPAMDLAKKYVPLSIFFLELDGVDVEADEEKAKKSTKWSDSDSPNATSAKQANLPKKKKSRTEEGITLAANVATTPVPLGRKTKTTRSERDLWIKRLLK